MALRPVSRIRPAIVTRLWLCTAAVRLGAQSWGKPEIAPVHPCWLGCRHAGVLRSERLQGSLSVSAAAQALALGARDEGPKLRCCRWPMAVMAP